MSFLQPKTPVIKASGKSYQAKRYFSISKPSLKYGDHPDQIKTLVKIVDMTWEKNSAKIYGFIMASQQWQMPPLYIDRIFTMDDLYDLIKSDPLLEEISAIATTRAIPQELLEQAHAEDFKVAMSKQHINFNPTSSYLTI